MHEKPLPVPIWIISSHDDYYDDSIYYHYPFDVARQHLSSFAGTGARKIN